MTVLVWMFTNFVVIALVLETGGFNQFVEATDLANLKSNRAAVFFDGDFMDSGIYGII